MISSSKNKVEKKAQDLSSKIKTSKKDGGKRERAERKIRGKVIFNDDEDDALKENIIKVDKKMTRDDVQFVIVSLMKHFFFRNLSDDEL